MHFTEYFFFIAAAAHFPIQCHFCQSQTIFITVFRLGFHCLLKFSVILSLLSTNNRNKYVQLYQIVWYKCGIKHLQRTACLSTKTGNHSAKQSVKLGNGAETGRAIEPTPLLITTHQSCGESVVLITALLYRPGSNGRIENRTNALCK